MIRSGLAAGILAIAAVGTPAPAAAVSLGAFSSFYVLGDSLSDNGNAYDASFGLVPQSPPYWRGRFSNGPVWSDRVARAFDRQGVETGNLAFGGAKARTDRDGIPDLKAQLGEYAVVSTGERGDRPLVALWAGGNDILNGDSASRAGGKAAAQSVGSVARSLVRGGVDDLLMFNLPDLGTVPSGNGSPRESRANTRATIAFNREIARQIDGLRDDGVRVYSVDVYSLFEELLAHPRRFGVSNTTTPCLDEDDNLCTPRQERQRAFFDSTHPSKTVHASIAAAARDALAGRGDASAPMAMAATTAGVVPMSPVPLPASGLMLVAALGLTSAAVARRRARPRP